MEETSCCSCKLSGLQGSPFRNSISTSFADKTVSANSISTSFADKNSVIDVSPERGWREAEKSTQLAEHKRDQQTYKGQEVVKENMQEHLEGKDGSEDK